MTRSADDSHRVNNVRRVGSADLECHARVPGERRVGLVDDRHVDVAAVRGRKCSANVLHRNDLRQKVAPQTDALEVLASVHAGRHRVRIAERNAPDAQKVARIAQGDVADDDQGVRQERSPRRDERVDGVHRLFVSSKKYVDRRPGADLQREHVRSGEVEENTIA